MIKIVNIQKNILMMMNNYKNKSIIFNEEIIKSKQQMKQLIKIFNVGFMFKLWVLEKHL